MTTAPAFVVGVGRAGIRVASVLADVAEENDDREKFEFVAIDTDPVTLSQCPGETLRVRLDHDSAFVDEDIGTYPYLNRTLSARLSERGTMRRRPVGRYKLDSRGLQNFSQTYDALWGRARDHCDVATATTGTSDCSFNIYVIHSHGGGTGSGTFPLLAAMLDEIGNALEETTPITETYIAGVGIVPQLALDPDIRDTGAEWCLPNVYAALRDIDTLESLSQPGESQKLPIYARALQDSPAGSDSKFELDRSPFDDYWLFDVDEYRMSGSAEGSGAYAEQVDQTIARSLRALSKIDIVEDWAEEKPSIGSFDQSEIRVPHGEVLDYYELRSEREQKQEQMEADIPQQISDLRSRKTELEQLKQSLTDGAARGSDVEDAVKDRIYGEIPHGEALVSSKTVTDVEEILENIEREFDMEGVIIATNVLGSTLEMERGAPSVKADRTDIITGLWSEYAMSTRPKFDGESATSIQSKANALREFLTHHIDRYEEVIDSWNPGLIERVRDTLPPHGPFESDREEAERVLAKLRDSLDDLERVESAWGRVNEIEGLLDHRRRSARNWIDEQLQNVNSELSDLLAKRDQLQQDIDTITDDIESARASLATKQANQRTIVLALDTEGLEDLSPETADSVLTSLSSYIEEGLIDQQQVELAVNRCVDLADAGANRRVTEVNFDFDGYREPTYQPVQDTFFLFHEDIEACQHIMTRAMDGGVYFSGERLDYLSDPYRIQFVSFDRRGPVPNLTLYQQLDELAADGTLDDYAGQYSGDHRLAFAYPEWYADDIRKAFGSF